MVESQCHPHDASSHTQEELLWERKLHFNHVRLNKVFSMCQRNSASGLNRALQCIYTQNCGCVG